MTHPDDRRYMTHEQRAADDPRYRSTATSEGRTVTCACGKTVYYSANGAVVSDRCPRNCDSGRNPR